MKFNKNSLIKISNVNFILVVNLLIDNNIVFVNSFINLISASVYFLLSSKNHNTVFKAYANCMTLSII